MNLEVTCEADKTTGAYRDQSFSMLLGYKLQDYDKESVNLYIQLKD